MSKCTGAGCVECAAFRLDEFKRANLTTQQRYPNRAVARTVLVNVITWVPIVAAALVYLANGEGRPRLPEQWELWLSFAASWAIAISGLLTRIIANPVVDAKLRKIGVSSSPNVNS